MGAFLPTTQQMAVTVCYTIRSILPRDKLGQRKMKEIVAALVAYLLVVVLLERCFDKNSANHSNP